MKPNVSAGARDTGRFGPAAHDAALELIESIRANGRVALVQPYMSQVDARGETSLVFLGGVLSHVLNKRSVLRGEGVAPTIDGALPVAAVMLEDDLVVGGRASRAEQALARRTLAEISERFGSPVYARVDLVMDSDGEPRLLELEAIEPSLYLTAARGASERLAAAVRAS